MTMPPREHQSSETAGVVIAIPSGVVAAGVPVWGVRLANALAERGRSVAVVTHEPDDAYAPLECKCHPQVRRFDVTHAPPLEQCNGDLSPYLTTYRDAIECVWRHTHRPVVFSPNLAGDCYGIAAALSLSFADRLRIVAVQHSDIEYESRYLAHYASLVSRYVVPSSHLQNKLCTRIAGREPDIRWIPHGVPVNITLPSRAPIVGRPLNILYVGRMDRHVKRVLALPALSMELERRGIEHRMVLVGDGPASEGVDHLLSQSPNARRHAVLPPEQVRAMLERADVLVLPSRYEGMNLAMLEAMGAGCVPVVSRVQSGAADAITHGVDGELVDVSSSAGDSDVVAPFADAIVRVLQRGVAGMSVAAWRTASELFSLERYAKRFEEVLDEVSQSPARVWPADRACSFSGDGAAAAGLVPADAGQRMQDVLRSLSNRRIAIHGAGRHTLALASVLAHSPATIVAIADDDTSKCGQALWGWPIVAPADLASLRVTDVVLSSAMHEADILRRSNVYTSRGIRVHALYHNAPALQSAA